MTNKNDIKFYVSEEVLEILFDFLKTEQNIKKLEDHIKNNMTLKEGQDINAEDDKHPEEYFTQIKTKIEQIKTFINKDFKALSQEDQKVLAEFLYSLEDLSSDKTVYPEDGKKTKQGKENELRPKMPEPLLTLLLIRVLTLPVIEQCQYRYDYDSTPQKTTNINLVQDFNFLEERPGCLDHKRTEYGFLNFYPFNEKFEKQQDAIKFHYNIMAKNYFSYLKDVIDNNPNKFFVCYKPGVRQFGDHTGMIEEIFKSEYDKLDKEYKDRMLFCVNSKPIDGVNGNGFKYDYTVEDLSRIYPDNKFLSSKTCTGIFSISGVARDPWAKIGNEGRWKVNRTDYSYSTSTDAKFVKDSNETEKLYGVETSNYKRDSIKNLNAKPAEIHIDRTKIIQKSSEENKNTDKTQIIPISIGENEGNRKLNALYKGHPLFTSDKQVIIYDQKNECLIIQPVEEYYEKVKKQQEEERKRHNIDLRGVPKIKKNNNKKLQTTTHTNKKSIKRTII